MIDTLRAVRIRVHWRPLQRRRQPQWTPNPWKSYVPLSKRGPELLIWAHIERIRGHEGYRQTLRWWSRSRREDWR